MSDEDGSNPRSLRDWIAEMEMTEPFQIATYYN